MAKEDTLIGKDLAIADRQRTNFHGTGKKMVNKKLYRVGFL